MSGISHRSSGDFRSSYQKEEPLIDTSGMRMATIVFVVVLLICPVLLNVYHLSILIQIGYFGIAALGLNILVGYTGQISLGHAAFFGFGAFTSTYLNNEVGVPVFFAIPLAGLVTAIVGMLFGAPAARIRGLYLAIATFAAEIILEDFFGRAEWFTGGAAGALASPFSIFGYEAATDQAYLYVIIAYSVLLTIFAANFLRTRDGRALIAVRDHYLSAEIMGINLTRYRIMSFGISSFYAGIGGALMVHYLSFVSSESITILLSIQFLAMVIIGGLGTIKGAWLGAAFMVLMPEMLESGVSLVKEGGYAEQLPWLTTGVEFMKEAMIGLVIVAFLIFEPRGLAYLWQLIRASWKRYPFSY